MRKFRKNGTFGKLSTVQAEVVGNFVLAKHVVDLGAFDLRLSYEMSALGARRVDAYDAFPMPEPSDHKILIDGWHKSFSELGRCWQDNWGEVALLSWPSNTMDAKETRGLIRVLEHIPKVMYFGCNTDGTACGTRELFAYLWDRKVLEEVSEVRNTLIVYGRSIRQLRAPLAEELAGIDRRRCYTFEKAHEAADWMASQPDVEEAVDAVMATGPWDTET